MVLQRGFLFVIAVGCGSVTGASTPSPDAESSPADAQRECDPGKPFDAPTIVANINDADRDEFAFLADDLTIYLASQRVNGSGSMDLYVATRPTVASPFKNPTSIVNMNSSATEQAPCLGLDELTMYYTFVSAIGPTGDIYATTRGGVVSAFFAGDAVAQVNSGDDEGDPFVTAGDAMLYFSSNRPGAGHSYDIYSASRRSDGSFDLPQPASELNTTVDEGHPVLTADGLTIYWASKRTDGGSQGETDIWTASRSSTSEPFGNIARVPELNSAYRDAPDWISSDGCKIYIETTRPGGPGGTDIWEAVKPR